MYKIKKNSVGENVIFTTLENGLTISFVEDEANTDYQEYLKWVAEGNEPLPADEVNNV